MAGRRVPIGTVADRYGVPATTLRYWEDAGLLPPQERSGGSHALVDHLQLLAGHPRPVVKGRAVVIVAGQERTNRIERARTAWPCG
jgi:hypothetical protein